MENTVPFVFSADETEDVGEDLATFELSTSGLLNKQASAELGISEKTIKVHRARVMHKMQAESLAALVRMADQLKTQTAGTIA